MAMNVLEKFDTTQIPGRLPSVQPAPQQPQPQMQGQQPGTWDLGGSGSNAVGRIADAFAQYGGMTPQYQTRLDKQRYENALELYKRNPEQGITELQKVAPQVANQLETTRLENQKTQMANEAAAQKDFYSTLRRARDAGQDIGPVIDTYAQGPYGSVIFDTPDEVQQAKQMFAKAPEMIDIMGGGPVALSGHAAEHLGFKPGTVLQFGEDGYKVLQEPKEEKEPTPYTDAGKISADLRNGLLTPEQAEQAKLKLDAPSPESFKDATKLRQEYLGQIKDFQKARDSYGRVLASADEPSAAGDLALIFNYMKVLDPGSVVRESEFATAAKAGDYGDRIQGAVNRVLNGERLSAEQRKDFVVRAAKLFRKQRDIAERTADNYRALSSEFSIDPSLVVQNQYGGFTGNEQVNTGGGPEVPQISSPEEWNNLQPGQQYRDPQGNIRTKQ